MCIVKSVGSYEMQWELRDVVRIIDLIVVFYLVFYLIYVLVLLRCSKLCFFFKKKSKSILSKSHNGMYINKLLEKGR